VAVCAIQGKRWPRLYSADGPGSGASSFTRLPPGWLVAAAGVLIAVAGSFVLGAVRERLVG